MSRRFGLTLGAAAVVIAIGLFAQSVAGAPRSLVMAQGVVGLIALGLAAGVAVLRPDPRSRLSFAVCGLALAAMAAPLAFPGIEGVHRWVPLGPVQVQPAAIALPVLVWFAAGRRDTWIGPATMVLAAMLAAAQPDSQAATGVLASVIAVFLLYARGPGWALALAASVVAVAVAAFGARLDPVLHVEQVLRIAFVYGLPFGLIAVAALIAIPLLPLAAARDPRDPTAIAFAALWIGLCAVVLSAQFPTPVIGFGLSWLIGLGLTLGLARSSARERLTAAAPRAEELSA